MSVETTLTPTLRELQEHIDQCPPCQQEWLVFQQTLIVLSTTPQPLLSSQQSVAMWDACSHCLMEKIEASRLAGQQPAWWRSPFGQWVLNQPKWGWAALGGAAAVFGAAWFLSPEDASNTETVSFAGIGPDTYIRFERPPAAASPFITNHSAMAFDPFTDHVGSTLVSYSATDRSR